MGSYPGSAVAFSQVREDPAIELEVVERIAHARGRPVRVLLVASGGCTALSLLASPAVAQIVAVDASPAQLHLVELKRCALATLELRDQLDLLGAAPGPTPRARIAIYERLRPALPSATREHWDARAREVAFGVNRVGRFEELFRELAAAFARAGLDPSARPAEAASSPALRAAFDEVMERGRLIEKFGVEAVTYSMNRSFAEHFAAVLEHALRTWSVRDNYFLLSVLEDRYAPAAGLVPPYLKPETQRAIRERLDRLSLAGGALRGVVRELPKDEPFDVVQTSNVSDWMPVPEVESMLDEIAELVPPGGAVIGRRLNGDHVLADVMARRLDVDRASSESLHRRDRSFFYSEVVVGLVRGGAGASSLHR